MQNCDSNDSSSVVITAAASFSPNLDQDTLVGAPPSALYLHNRVNELEQLCTRLLKHVEQLDHDKKEAERKLSLLIDDRMARVESRMVRFGAELQAAVTRINNSNNNTHCDGKVTVTPLPPPPPPPPDNPDNNNSRFVQLESWHEEVKKQMEELQANKLDKKEFQEFSQRVQDVVGPSRLSVFSRIFFVQ